MWSMKGDQVTELSSTGADVGALHVYDRQLYAGDEDGNVSGQDEGIKLLLLLNLGPKYLPIVYQIYSNKNGSCTSMKEVK